MIIRRTLTATLAGFAFALLALPMVPAVAADVTLKAISAFPRGNTWTVPLERMIERINKEGVLKVKYLGGSESMHPFEVGNAVKNGVVDIANATGSYYATLLPEGLARIWGNQSAKEMRASAAWDYVQKVYHDKMNTHIIADLDMSPIMLWLRDKKLDGPDFKGLKMRGNPLFRPFLEKFGATVVRMPMTEIYTALERGVVDGFGYPLVGMEDLGFHKFTKYRIEPSFARGPTDILVNLDTWNKLTAKQQAYLTKLGLWLEAENEKNVVAAIAKSRKVQDAAGIKTLDFGKAYAKEVREIGWNFVVAKSPKYGAKLKELLLK